jgi:hypothetical protein
MLLGVLRWDTRAAWGPEVGHQGTPGLLGGTPGLLGGTPGLLGGTPGMLGGTPGLLGVLRWDTRAARGPEVGHQGF